MKKNVMKLLGAFVLMLSMLGLSAYSTAEAAKDAGFEPKHKLVIQVSSKDPLIQKMAMNNAVNIQKAYGVENVAVEIVAYGPGLSMLTKKSKYSERVKSLAIQGITFSACGNTIKKITKKKGKSPKLTDGVVVVSAGVQRIMELQEKGYSYIRP